jgi:hypothetical protein
MDLVSLFPTDATEVAGLPGDAVTALLNMIADGILRLDAPPSGLASKLPAG